jgi:solute carrier family 25 (mitochondrial phosphate transporter), member 3
MALFDQSSRHSLVPGYLYSSNALSSHLDTFSINNSNINHAGLPTSSSHSSSPRPHDYTRKNVPMIPSPNEGIRMFSPAYYAACSAGGVFSCGLTHMAVTPLDLVKCNMQVCMQYYNCLNDR